MATTVTALKVVKDGTTTDLSSVYVGSTRILISLATARGTWDTSMSGVTLKVTVSLTYASVPMDGILLINDSTVGSFSNKTSGGTISYSWNALKFTVKAIQLKLRITGTTSWDNIKTMSTSETNWTAKVSGGERLSSPRAFMLTEKGVA